MADLTKFVSSQLRSGLNVSLHLNRWPQIGDGKIAILTPLLLEMTGKGSVFGFPFAANIKITMPDLAPSGECEIKINTDEPIKAKYETKDNQLLIYAYELIIYPEGNWTWVHIAIPDKPKAWIGVWPAGPAMTDADMIPSVESSSDKLP